jgi:hypothetical protein
MADETKQVTAQPQGSTPPPDDIPTITPEQAKAALDDSKEAE